MDLQACRFSQDVDENKLSYTDTFHEYQAVVERNLEQRLSAAIPDFSMDSFIQVGRAGSRQLSLCTWPAWGLLFK